MASLNLQKSIAVVTLGAYLFSFILCEPLKAAGILFENCSISARLTRALGSELLPQEFGKITASRLFGRDTLVVCIQDLHCNPYVQKNIYNIISHFARRYGVSAIFSEGAPQGRVNTRLMTSVPDDGIRADLLSGLLRNGLISGAEYYAVSQNKDILYGLEDWNVYSENLSRIHSIIERQSRYRVQAEQVHGWISALKEKYLSRRIRDYEDRVISSRENGGQALYNELEKLSAESGQSLRDYPHLDRYLRLRRCRAGINSGKIAEEQRSYLNELARQVPFSVYQELTGKTADGNASGEYYSALAELSRLYAPSIHLSAYPNLSRYLEQVRLMDAINPVALLYEQKDFLRKALEKNANTLRDREMLFLSEMDPYLKDFYLLHIDPLDYEFFKAHYPQFKAVMKKYVADPGFDEVFSDLGSGEAELFKFYDVNKERNKIFFNAVKAQAGIVNAPVIPATPEQMAGCENLGRFKNIFIVVVGGFHGELAQLFNSAGISNITVTPSVADGGGSGVYFGMLDGSLDPVRFINACFAPVLLDVGMPRAMVDIVICNWARKAEEKQLSTTEMQDDLNGWLQANNLPGDVSIAASSSPGILYVSTRGKNYTVDIKGLTAKRSANQRMKERVFSKYGGEEAVRASLQAQGADVEALLGTGTDWGLVYGKLEQLNQAGYTEKTYGEEVESINLGELWRSIKSGLIKENKLNVRSSAAVVFYMASGRFALHLFRSFYIRHPGSALRYHWRGRNKEVYIPAQLISRAVVDQLRDQQRLKAGMAGKLRIFIRRFFVVVRPFLEITLISAHLRFLKERSSLFFVTTIITGSILSLVAANPLVWLPLLAVVYVYAVVKWAPEKGEKNGLLSARGWHLVRMTAIPAVLLGLFLISLCAGTPFLGMNLLGLLPKAAAQMQSAVILGTLYKGFAVQAILSPLITVFVRSFVRATREATYRALGSRSFNLRLESYYRETVGKDGKIVSTNYIPASAVSNGDIGNKKLVKVRGFVGIDQKFVPWVWDGATMIAYLEAQKSRGAISPEVQSVIASILAHDGKKWFGYHRLLRANAVQREQISLLAGDAITTLPQNISDTEIDLTIKEARLAARRDVFGNAYFWKRLPSAWFSMWFVNTEIAVVLKQLKLFDWIISKCVSIFHKNTIHFIEQLGQLVEGANSEHPVAAEGLRLYGPDDLLGKFAGSGGLLGSFANLVTFINGTINRIPHVGGVFSALSDVPALISALLGVRGAAQPALGKDGATQLGAEALPLHTVQKAVEPNKFGQEPGIPAAIDKKFLPGGRGPVVPRTSAEPPQTGHAAVMPSDDTGMPEVTVPQKNEGATLPAAPAGEYRLDRYGAFVTPEFAAYANIDMIRQNSTLHLHYNDSPASGRSALNLNAQYDPASNRRFIPSVSVDRLTQPYSEFPTAEMTMSEGSYTSYKLSSRGSLLNDKLLYSADLFTSDKDKYPSAGETVATTKNKFLPKVALRYSDPESGADVNAAAYNLLDTGKKISVSGSRSIPVSSNLTLAPWADLSYYPDRKNTAKDRYTGNYGLVSRLSDVSASAAVKTTQNRTALAADDIRYYKIFREGWGTVSAGARNIAASLLEPRNAAAPREFYADIRNSKLAGLSVGKGDVNFSYSDTPQRLKLDYALYMPAVSETLKVVNLGADISRNAAADSTVWAGAAWNNFGFRYKQSLGTFTKPGKLSAAGEVFVLPGKNLAVSAGAMVKDGAGARLTSGIEINRSTQKMDYSVILNASAGSSAGSRPDMSAALGFVLRFGSERPHSSGGAAPVWNSTRDQAREMVKSVDRTLNNLYKTADKNVERTIESDNDFIAAYGDIREAAGAQKSTLENIIAKASNSVGKDYLTAREYLDTLHKALLLSRDTLMGDLLGLPPDFKFGDPRPHFQKYEGILLALAGSINTGSGYFNSLEAQGRMKVKKNTVSEKEYAEDIIEAANAVADTVRREEILSLLKRFIKNKAGWEHEFQNLDEASQAKNEEAGIKPKVEKERGRLFGPADIDKKETAAYGQLAADAHRDADIKELLAAKTEIKKIFEENPKLRGELVPPAQGSEMFKSMFAQFVEQKRFSEQSAVEVERAQLIQEFNNTYPEWKLAYYARQLVTRYHLAVKDDGGADTTAVWDRTLKSVKDELDLGRAVMVFKYRVSDKLGGALRTFGECLGVQRAVFEVEAVRDVKGRVTELTAFSDQGRALFKIMNDQTTPSLELFDYRLAAADGGAGAYRSRSYEFRIDDGALGEALLGQPAALARDSIGLLLGEKVYAVERRGDSWLRPIDVRGVKFLPGHRPVRFGEEYRRDERDKGFEEEFVRNENPDGTYTKHFTKAGLTDRDETCRWTLESEMPVRTVFASSEYGLPLEEVFEGRNNMKSRVYLRDTETGVRKDAVYENTYAYDSRNYARFLKTKLNKVTGVREEWKETGDASVVVFEGRVTTAKGLVLSTKRTTQKRNSPARIETSRDMNGLRDVTIVNTLTGREKIDRYDVQGNSIYTETSSAGENAYVRAFTRTYADKQPAESGFLNLRTREASRASQGSKHAPIVKISLGKVDADTMRQRSVREDALEGTVTVASMNVLTGAESSVTYPASDKTRTKPLYRSDTTALDYDTMKKTTTTVKHGPDGGIEWKKTAETSLAGSALINLGGHVGKSVHTVETKRDGDGRVLEINAVSDKGLKLFSIVNNDVLPVIELFDHTNTAGGETAHSVIYEFRDPALAQGSVEGITYRSIGKMTGKKSYRMESLNGAMKLIDAGGIIFLPGHRAIAYGEPYRQSGNDRNFEETFTRKENADGTSTKTYFKAGLLDRTEVSLWRQDDGLPLRTIYTATELGVPLVELFEGMDGLTSKTYLFDEKTGRRAEDPVYENTYTWDLRTHRRILEKRAHLVTGLREEWRDVSPDTAHIVFENTTTTAEGKLVTKRSAAQLLHSYDRTETKEEPNGTKEVTVLNTLTGERKTDKYDFKGRPFYTEIERCGANASMRSFVRTYADKRPTEIGWLNLRSRESGLTVFDHLGKPSLETRVGPVNSLSMKQPYTRKDTGERINTIGETELLTGAETSRSFSADDVKMKLPLYAQTVSALDYATMMRTSKKIKYREDDEGRLLGLAEWSEDGLINTLYGAGNFTKRLADGRVMSEVVGLDEHDRPLTDASGNYYSKSDDKLLRQMETTTYNSDFSPRESVKTTYPGKFIEKMKFNVRAPNGSLENRTESVTGDEVVEQLDRFSGSTRVKEVYFNGQRTSRTEYGFKIDTHGKRYFSAFKVNDLLDTEQEDSSGSHRAGYIRRSTTRNKGTKEVISVVNSNDGLSSTGYNYDTKEPAVMQALYVNGPVVSRIVYAPASRLTDHVGETVSNEIYWINDDGSVTVTVELLKSRTSLTSRYDYYGGVLRESMEEGRDGFALYKKIRQNVSGTEYLTERYNGVMENSTLEHPGGAVVKVSARDKDGTAIFTMANSGGIDTYNYANGDVTRQTLKYRGGPMVKTATVTPSGRERSRGVVEYNENGNRWELRLEYPGSRSKHFEVKEMARRDGPVTNDTVLSSDKTVVLTTAYAFNGSDGKIHRISHYYGDQVAGNEIKTEDYELLFMNGQPAQGVGAATITEYRYSPGDGAVPPRNDAVTYSVDISYPANNYTVREESVFRLEGGRRMPDRDSVRKMRLIAGEWRPVYTEGRYMNWLLPSYGTLVSSYEYDETGSGLLRETSSDFVDPSHAPFTLRNKNEKLAAFSSLNSDVPEQKKILEDVDRVLAEIAGLTDKGNGNTAATRVRIPRDDLFIGLVYESSLDKDGRAVPGKYLGMNLYLNDASDMRLVASEEKNVVTTERRINVVYELDDGKKAVHGYTRGTSGLIGSVNIGLDYPVYFKLEGPSKNELVRLNRAPLYQGKDEVKGNEVEELYPLGSQGLSLFKAYDPVMGNIYETKDIATTASGAFTYKKGPLKTTMIYRSAREGKAVLPHYYIEPVSSLMKILLILATAFYFPYRFIKNLRNHKTGAVAPPEQVRETTDGSNGNGNGNGDISDPFSRVKDLLTEWEDMLQHVKDLPAAGRQRWSEDCLNRAMLVINLTPFKISDSPAGLVSLNEIYNRMYTLSLETLRSIQSSGKNSTGNEEEKLVQLNLVSAEFGDIARYSANFVNLTSSIDNLLLLSGYMLPKNSFLERTLPFTRLSIMNLTRFVYGLRFGFTASSRLTKESIRNLVRLGNKIDPGLYENPARTVSTADDYTDSIAFRGNGAAFGIRQFWKPRRALPRVMGLFMITSIVCSFAFLNAGISLDFLRSFFCGVGLSAGASWFFVFRGLNEMYEHKITRIDEELKHYAVDNYSEEFRDIEQRSAFEARDRELKGESPAANVIVVMAKNGSSGKYNELAARWKNSFVRGDVPVAVVPYEGEDGDAYAAAFHFLADTYPAVNRNGTAMVLVTGAGITDDEQMESVLMNGYKAAQAFAQKDKDGSGRKIFINTALRYTGPIKSGGEITLVGSWANYDQVEAENLNLVLSARDGGARKIYHDFKMVDIVDKLERQALTSVFDRTNAKKRQMPVLSGITLFNFGDQQKERDFVALLEQAPKGFSVTKDVFNPLILFKNEGVDEMYKSLISRNIPANGRGRMFALFNQYVNRYGRNGKVPFNFKVYLPHLHETYLEGTADDGPVLPEPPLKTPEPLRRTPREGLAAAEGGVSDNGELATPLERAAQSLDEWERLLRDRNGTFAEQDAVRVLNLVKNIVNLTVFKPKTAVINRVALHAVYVRFATLSMRTIRTLKGRYDAISASDELSREKFRLLISEFAPIAKYGTAFAGTTGAIDDLELMSGYVLPEKSLYERSGALRFMRFWFGFEYGLIESVFRVKNRARELVKLGNAIEPDLYQDPGRLIEEVDGYTNAAEKQKKNEAIGISKNWKLRKVWPRTVGLLVFLYSIFDIALFRTGIPVSFLVSVIMFGMCSVGVSWYFILRGLDDGYASSMRNVDKEINGLATEGYAQRLLSRERDAASGALLMEMKSEKPLTDIVLIMAEPDKVEKYQKLLLSLTGSLIRKDITSIVLPFEGRDGAAYAAAFHYLAEKFPGLNRTGRSLVLVTGSNPGDYDNIAGCLTNGYKAAHALADEKDGGAGGKIFIDAGLNYVGPVKRHGEITMVGSWAGFDQVLDESMKIVLSDNEGRALKLYPDIREGIQDKLGRHFLYDKNNTKKRQIPVLGGITLSNSIRPKRRRNL